MSWVKPELCGTFKWNFGVKKGARWCGCMQKSWPFVSPRNPLLNYDGHAARDSGFWIQNFPIPTNLVAAVYLGKYFEPFKQFPLTNMRKLPIGGFTNKLHRKIFVKNGQHMLNLLPTQMHQKYLYKLFLCTSLNISAILKPPSVESWKSWKSSLAHFNQP